MRDGDHGARMAMLRAKMAQLTEERSQANCWELDRRRSAASMTEAIAMAHRQPAWATHLDSIDITRFRAASKSAREPRGGCGGREQQRSPMTSSAPPKEKLALPDQPSLPFEIDIEEISSVEVKSDSAGGSVLIIYLKRQASVVAPATARNISYLKGKGIEVKNDHSAVDAPVEAMPETGKTDAEPPEAGAAKVEEGEVAPSKAAGAAPSKWSRGPK